MLDLIKKELTFHNIELCSFLPLSECVVTRPDKVSRCGFDGEKKLSVIIFAIPYYSKGDEKNISSYAIPRDYHLFCKDLFASILPKLEQMFKGYQFYGFADNSPIDERNAAAKAGLGMIGDNGMLITEKYSSYVFLAEIITDLPFDHASVDNAEIKHCEHCGACINACPMKIEGLECLSAVTQKKGELSEVEKRYIIKYGSAWGCDICQEVCPHTLSAKASGTIYSPIGFFNADLTPRLSTSLIEEMSDAEFSERAYSWRKKETILRNLKLFDK